MIIDELEIEGFKSYKERTVFKKFGDNFTAITGNNGSGKSNVLDSICFVLGLSNTNIIRVSKIQELIHSTGGLRSNQAKIILTLRIVELNKMYSENQKRYKRKVISRYLQRNGKNRYFLDGVNVSPSKILNFLYSISLNINNPHFLVRQGHITNVTFMSHIELFELFENSIGTRLYEIKKNIAIETIKKKKEGLNCISVILKDKIKPILLKWYSLLKKIKKVRIYQKNTIKYSKVYGQTNFIHTKQLKKGFKHCRLKIFEKKLSQSVVLDNNLRSIKSLTGKDEEKLKLKLKKVFILLKSKKNYYKYWRNLIHLNKIIIFSVKSKKKITKYNFFLVIENKIYEKIYFRKLLFFKKNHWKKYISCEIKENLKKKFEFADNILTLESERKLWFFVNLLMTILKNSFLLLKKDKLWFTNDFRKYIIFNRLQIYIVSKYKHSFKIFSNFIIKKKQSFFKEDLNNLLYSFSEPRNKEDGAIWIKRKLIVGIILSLVQPKSPTLTSIYQYSVSSKININIIINELQMKKIVENLKFKQKNDIFFIERTCFNKLEEKIILNIFRIKSFLGFSENLSRIIGLNTNYYLLPSIKKLKKIILLSSYKNFDLITPFGEIFRPAINFFVCGRFCGNKNVIFTKIKVDMYTLNWIRFGLTFKKKMILRTLYWNFNFVKKCDKSKSKMISRIKNKCSRLKPATQLNLEFIHIFNSKKMNIVKSEKFFFLRKLKNFIRNDYVSFKSFIQKFLKFFLKLVTLNCNKIKYYNAFLMKKIKYVSLKFLVYLINSIKLFIIWNFEKKRLKTGYKDLNIKVEMKKCFLPSIYPIKFNCNCLNKNSIATSIKNRFFEFSSYHRIHLTPSCLSLKMYFKNSQIEFFGVLRNSGVTLDIEYFEIISLKYKEFLFKRIIVEKDRLSIEEIILRLDFKREKILILAFKKMNSTFKTIFHALVPIHNAVIITKKNSHGKWIGIEFKVFITNNQTNSRELSGGQNSILALSFIFSLLLFKPAPFYILDEIDAALDFYHTKNISQLIFQNFMFSQFIIVSLKKQIILDAEVVFEVKQVSNKSYVTRLQKLS